MEWKLDEAIRYHNLIEKRIEPCIEGCLTMDQVFIVCVKIGMSLQAKELALMKLKNCVYHCAVDIHVHSIFIDDHLLYPLRMSERYLIDSIQYCAFSRMDRQTFHLFNDECLYSGIPDTEQIRILSQQRNVSV